MPSKILRSLRLLKLRVLRQKDSIHAIAWGAVIGLMVGMMVPMGGQIIIAVTLSFIFKANKLAASTFTFISNPWTVVILYPFQILFGARLVGSELSANVAKEFKVACEGVEFWSWNFESISSFFSQYGWSVMGYFLLGGFIIGAVVSAITYPLVIQALVRHTKLRERRTIFRAERRRKKLLKMIENGDLPPDFPVD